MLQRSAHDFFAAAVPARGRPRGRGRRRRLRARPLAGDGRARLARHHVPRGVRRHRRQRSSTCSRSTRRWAATSCRARTSTPSRVAGETILAVGTDAQKRALAPAIADGQIASSASRSLEGDGAFGPGGVAGAAAQFSGSDYVLDGDQAAGGVRAVGRPLPRGRANERRPRHRGHLAACSSTRTPTASRATPDAQHRRARAVRGARSTTCRPRRQPRRHRGRRVGAVVGGHHQSRGVADRDDRRRRAGGARHDEPVRQGPRAVRRPDRPVPGRAVPRVATS